ncbi:MAG: phenylalanine--tRNA ligase subunit beta [Armatimonadetes bacterium]|nr:phenylalanine--tRNA ligase subunit beta [Armatimonadota bacterium]
MKFTESMLRDYVETSMTAEEIGNLLTMTGFELEEITEVNGEKVLDVNIMANRGDGASVIGMAREVLAKDESAKPTDLYLRAMNGFPLSDMDSRDIWAKASVAIETENCTRFSARVFEGISNGTSPDWMQDRLTKLGQRPISLLVDLTNYVMLETGQPMHAYDLDTVAGDRLVARQAKAGEKLRTLDGQDHDLNPDQMMIADGDRVVGAGGIMGGEETEVSATTTRCLLEAAHFVNTSVRKTRKEMGLQTEASYRFERHVDPEGTVGALNRFAELLADAGGPNAVHGVIDIYPAKAERNEVTVRMDRACRLLGMEISMREAQAYLTRLGFEILSSDDNALTVAAPTWRIDVIREEDVIEEIGRVHGYEKIPEINPEGTTGRGGVHGIYRMVDDAVSSLVRDGFVQSFSHTLGDAHPLDAPGMERTILRNPHSPEMAHLRNSHLPNLSATVLKNGQDNVHTFEVGKLHKSGTEWHGLGIISCGNFESESWRETDKSKADFFTLKGVVESLGERLNRSITLAPSDSDERFHPTRQATLLSGRQVVGVIGQIHPSVAEATSLPEHAVIAEINLNDLFGAEATGDTFTSLSRNPAVRRDIAFVIDKSVAYSKIEDSIRASSAEVLEKMWLFDVYDGKGIPEGQHSLAIALQFRKHGNFTDEEANQVRDQIVAGLESLGAKLR